MGPPGVGKGTQAKIIKDKLGIAHISTGELLRYEIAEKTDVGAVAEKYIDQGISVNTSYNPEKFEDNKIPMSVMIQDLVTSYKYGLKQLYYFNTYDGAGEMKDDEHHTYDSGTTVMEAVDDDCDSCKI